MQTLHDLTQGQTDNPGNQTPKMEHPNGALYIALILTVLMLLISFAAPLFNKSGIPINGTPDGNCDMASYLMCAAAKQ